MRTTSKKFFSTAFLSLVIGLTSSLAYAGCPEPPLSTQIANGYQKQGVPPNTPPPGNTALPANSLMSCITMRETGGYQNVTNGWGYTGMFGFGVNAAASTGFCGPGSPALTTEYRCVQNWNACNFATSTMCAQYGVCSYAQFASNSANAIQASIAAQQILQNQNWNTILSMNPGLQQRIANNETIDGIPISQGTLLAMAQLRGAGNVKKWLDGIPVPPDANGTTQSGYANCVQKCLDNDPDAKTCDPRAFASCIHGKMVPPGGG